MTGTSIRIDEKTRARLEYIKEEMDAGSYDQVVDALCGQRSEMVADLTEPLRREVAGLEMELARDTENTLKERMKALEGLTPDELRIRAQRLSRERLWDVRGFLPESETTEEYQDLTDEEKWAVIEDMCDAALGPLEAEEMREEGLTAFQYIHRKYGFRPDSFPTRERLEEAMSAVRTGGDHLPKEEASTDWHEEDAPPGVLQGVKTAMERARGERGHENDENGGN